MDRIVNRLMELFINTDTKQKRNYESVCDGTLIKQSGFKG